MEPFDTIEKLISEHGSAKVLREHVDLLKSQMAAKDAEIEKLKSQLLNYKVLAKHPPIQGKADTCPYCRRATGNLIEIKTAPPPSGLLGIKQGYYECSNPACGKHYDREMPE